MKTSDFIPRATAESVRNLDLILTAQVNIRFLFMCTIAQLYVFLTNAFLFFTEHGTLNVNETSLIKMLHILAFLTLFLNLYSNSNNTLFFFNRNFYIIIISINNNKQYVSSYFFDYDTFHVRPGFLNELIC